MNWYIKHFSNLTTTELYKIIQQRITIFIVEQECPYPECDGKDLQAYHLYCQHKKEIIAYARIMKPGVSYKEAALGRVIVNQNYRRQGLGTSLMDKAIDFIKTELNQNSIRISAQEYAIPFYTNVGFKVVSETYLEDNIPHVEMLYQKN